MPSTCTQIRETQLKNHKNRMIRMFFLFHLDISKIFAVAAILMTLKSHTVTMTFFLSYEFNTTKYIEYCHS